MKTKLLILFCLALFVSYKSFATDFSSFSTCNHVGVVDWQIVCLDQYSFFTDSL